MSSLQYASPSRMGTEVITLQPDGSDAWRLEPAVELLKKGGVGRHRTGHRQDTIASREHASMRFALTALNLGPHASIWLHRHLGPGRADATPAHALRRPFAVSSCARASSTGCNSLSCSYARMFVSVSLCVCASTGGHYSHGHVTSPCSGLRKQRRSA